jgi:hypothetical protein
MTTPIAIRFRDSGDIADIATLPLPVAKFYFDELPIYTSPKYDTRG